MENELFNIIIYNKLNYPEEYRSYIYETAAHFDKEKIEAEEFYSLHTEYSYGKRELSNTLISNYPTLKKAHKNCIPQLWKSKEWAVEFANFLFDLIDKNASPTIIEIHPPFNDYCSIDNFIEIYSVFEKKIHSKFPTAIIVLENRSGSLYKGGKFLIEKADDISSLCECIITNDVNLGVVLDFPQLLTAERIDTIHFDRDKYFTAIKKLLPYRNLIKGIHIWGKKKSDKGRWIAHCGNLDTFFMNDYYKNQFIKGIFELCNDNTTRFLVPEVNSGVDDLESVVNDIIRYNNSIL